MSPFVTGIRSQARETGIAACVGVHEPAPAGRVRNTLLWIDEAGEMARAYRKLHLFDVDILGGPVIKESECVLLNFDAFLLEADSGASSTEKGEELLPPFSCGIGDMSIGFAICFDVC